MVPVVSEGLRKPEQTRISFQQALFLPTIIVLKGLAHDTISYVLKSFLTRTGIVDPTKLGQPLKDNPIVRNQRLTPGKRRSQAPIVMVKVEVNGKETNFLDHLVSIKRTDD